VLAMDASVLRMFDVLGAAGDLDEATPEGGEW
jgi:hypothetical protein